jgi:hypothetical protein
VWQAAAVADVYGPRSRGKPSHRVVRLLDGVHRERLHEAPLFAGSARGWRRWFASARRTRANGGFRIWFGGGHPAPAENIAGAIGYDAGAGLTDMPAQPEGDTRR